MASRDKERYYWLKLDRDFFKRHDIRVLESLPNGKDYELFYLKLICESIDHEGALRFSEAIPYNEPMLAAVTNTNVDIVKSALDTLGKLHMIEIFDDGTLYIREVEKRLGSETYAAKRKRDYREDMIAGDNVPRLSPDCPQDIEIEIETDKETDTEHKKSRGIFQEFAGDDKELLDALREFNEYRQKKHKPLTPEAKRRLCKKLEQFPRDQWVDILLQSIDQGWTGLWKLNGRVDSKTDKYVETSGFKDAISDLMKG